MNEVQQSVAADVKDLLKLKLEWQSVDDQIQRLQDRREQLKIRVERAERVGEIVNDVFLNRSLDEVGKDFVEVRTLHYGSNVRERSAECYWSRRTGEEDFWMVKCRLHPLYWTGRSEEHLLGFNLKWTQAQAREAAVEWLLHGTLIKEFPREPKI